MKLVERHLVQPGVSYLLPANSYCTFLPFFLVFQWSIMLL